RQAAGQVLLAAVAVDVQRVDLLPLGRLRGDAERRQVVFARQQHCAVQRPVGRGCAALDRQRATDAREQVRLLRERRQVLAARRELEERVGQQRDGQVLVPGAARAN